MLRHKDILEAVKILKNIDEPRLLKHTFRGCNMKAVNGFALALCIALSFSASADQIGNPSFENGWESWSDADPSGSGTSISGDARTGSSSVKITEKGAYVAQSVAVQPNTTYRLSAYVLGVGTLGVKAGAELFFDQSERRVSDWAELEVTFASGDETSISVFASHAGADGRFDDFQLEAIEGQAVEMSSRVLASSAGGTGLSPDLPPGRNFDLLDWSLNTPADDDGNGLSDSTNEVDLTKGFEDPRYFYTAEDGGMVFRATIDGYKTSKNTNYTRTELREMLRRGDASINTKTKDDGGPNKNNWVFSSTSERTQRLAGGVDGVLEATLAVNHVTTTGADYQIGRVIIGQIHADDNEPVRIYYRKLPENDKGSIYFYHEPAEGYGEERYVELLGGRSRSADDYANGIELDEVFSYKITAEGHKLSVKIYVDGRLRASSSVDMAESGYDVSSDYMYFKAGVYNQNNTGDPEDYAQATFYKLENSHIGYEGNDSL